MNGKENSSINENAQREILMNVIHDILQITQDNENIVKELNQLEQIQLIENQKNILENVNLDIIHFLTELKSKMIGRDENESK